MNSLKSYIKKILYKTKLYQLHMLRNRFYVIPYHMITEHSDGFFPQTKVSEFEIQIKHLAENYQVLPLDQIVQRKIQGKSLRKCVAITFDDGYRDNYEKAYPILKKYSVPATIFLTTDCIEQAVVPWSLKIRFAFKITQHKKYIHVEEDGTSKSYPLLSDVQRLSASNKAMAYLEKCENSKRLHEFDRIIQGLDIESFEILKGLMLNWDEIKEMAANKISFGAHTLSHPVMSRIDLVQAENEIFESKKVIEKKIGIPVKTFAYPFGKNRHINSKWLSVLKNSGYLCAVTTEIDINTYRTENFLINRMTPFEWSVLT